MSAKPAAKAAAIFPAPMKPTLMLVTVDATGIAMVRFSLFSEDEQTTPAIYSENYLLRHHLPMHF